MADENETKETKVVGLMAQVADKIAGSTGEVCDRLVGAMAEVEMSARVSLLDAAFQKRNQLSGALNKVNRSDNPLKDRAGKVVQELFTDSRLKEIKKAEDALNKLTNAMEKALSAEPKESKQAFQKLKEVVGK